MAKSLKELYGLREMAIEVPDENVGDLRKVVKQAVQLGILPSEADSWIPRKSKYVAKPEKPADDEPEAKPATPSPKKGKKAKAPEASPERQPIPTDPAVKADLDKSASAWDKLGQQSPEPSPFKSNDRWAPPKDTEFDPKGMAPGYGDDMPNLPEPKSANVKLNKHGQPLKAADDDHPDPDMFAHKKVGALSRVFGKKPPDQGTAAQPKRGALSRVFGKKQPQFQDNPYEFTPGNDWSTAGDPFAEPAGKKPAKKGPPLLPKSGGDDAMDDLGSFLGQNPGSKQAPPRTGDDAMNDLNWDLKRSRGKR